MIEKLKQWALDLNDRGIPLPLLRANGQGSYTLTMYWVSFNVAIVCLAGKATKHLEVDYSDVLWFYGVSAFIYLGRKFQMTKEGITVESAETTETKGESENE